MKKELLLLLCTLLSMATMAQSPAEVTTADYDRAVSMLSSNAHQLVYRSHVNPVWLSDGTFWYGVNTKDGREYVMYNLKTGERTTSTDRMSVDKEPVDRSKWDRYAAVSPDQKKEVFIRDWNLWVRDRASREEKQLTTDGIEDYGYATDNAGWRHSDKAIVKWSPDSRKVSTFQQDQRHVNDMYLVRTTVGAPELQKWKYPLPSDERVIQIQRVIIDVETGDMVRLQLPEEPRRGTLCDDISCTGEFDDNEWSADGSTLAFVSSSRDHKVAQLRIADTRTGEVRDVYREVSPTQYESGREDINWSYLPDTDEFIWYSESSNYGHLYLGDLSTGKIKNAITSGDWVVANVLHVDTDKRKIYFEGVGKEDGRDPYFAHLYSVNFDGSGLKLLTPEDGDHRVYMSPDYEYFVDNYSQPNVAPVSNLRRMDGSLVTQLEKAETDALMASGFPMPEPFVVKSDDGRFDLYGMMYLPSNMDKSKKYPVINYIYPGPQGGSVGSRSFVAGYRGHQAMAELGFVVIAIEGSCNPWRSKSFHDACYGNMSINTLPDQISGIRQLAERHSFIDLDRVGIWGRSGGGYATAAAMFKYPDFYKVGVSLSGNHDNRNYEDDWGERYIGLETGDNYMLQANQLYVDGLKGKLLIGTGNMDDNVPPYNTWLVVDAMIKANKDFDLLIVPHARHGFGEDSNYVMRRRWDYFVEHLMGATPPKEYKIK